MTPIPAMQAAAAALELALPLAKEEWTVRADWNTAGMAAIAKMESALSLLRAALDAGEPQPVAWFHQHVLSSSNGIVESWLSFDKDEAPDLKTEPGTSFVVRTPLYASPVAAAPQGDAKRLHDELLYAVHRKFPGESRHETALRYIRQAEAAATNPEPASASPTLNEQGKRAPGLRWQEDMRERLDEATKHLQANRWTEGFQSVQDALGLLDALGERGAVSPSCD